MTYLIIMVVVLLVLARVASPKVKQIKYHRMIHLTIEQEKEVWGEAYTKCIKCQEKEERKALVKKHTVQAKAASAGVSKAPPPKKVPSSSASGRKASRTKPLGSPVRTSKCNFCEDEARGEKLCVTCFATVEARGEDFALRQADEIRAKRAHQIDKVKLRYNIPDHAKLRVEQTSIIGGEDDARESWLFSWAEDGQLKGRRVYVLKPQKIQPQFWPKDSPKAP